MKKERLLLNSSLIYSSASVISIIAWAIKGGTLLLLSAGVSFELLLFCLYGCYLYCEESEEVGRSLASFLFVIAFPATLLYIIFSKGGDD